MLNFKDLPDTTTPINAENLNKAQEVDYSTNEVKIGKWIDGNDLYRKIFNITIGSTTQGTFRGDTATFTGHGSFYRIEWGNVKLTDGRDFSLPFSAEGSPTIQTYAFIAGNTITVRNNVGSFSGGYVTLSVIYTKN